jgi:hypothetical protein
MGYTEGTRRLKLQRSTHACSGSKLALFVTPCSTKLQVKNTRTSSSHKTRRSQGPFPPFLEFWERAVSVRDRQRNCTRMMECCHKKTRVMLSLSFCGVQRQDGATKFKGQLHISTQTLQLQFSMQHGALLKRDKQYLLDP